MPTPSSSPNEPSKFKRILNSNPTDDSVTSRLPRAKRVTSNSAPIIITPPPETVVKPRGYKFLEAFWTIASTMSILVNIVLIAIVFILLRMLGSIQPVANDKAAGLLANLYTSFAAMDNATISRVVPVDANIPLDLGVPVTLTGQRIVLAQDTPMRNVRVEIHEGGLDLVTRTATITLPQGTPLMVNLDPFSIRVQNSVPVHMEVPVKIPLNETELHAPFVQLRQTVQPYYCLLQPQAFYAGQQICP